MLRDQQKYIASGHFNRPICCTDLYWHLDVTDPDPCDGRPTVYSFW